MSNETNALDPVISHICGQLAPNDRVSNAVPPVEDNAGIEDDVDEAGGEPRGNHEVAKTNAVLRRVIGGRFIAARELNGWGQSEAAKMMGYGNSTQLSLIEQGKRMPPHDVILRASTVFGVALDYLYGLDDEPDRDSRAASRNAVIRRVHGLLERNVLAVTDALLAAHNFDPTPMVRASGLCGLVVELCNGVDLYRARNQAVFDETSCSALLTRTARNAREAVEKVSAALNRAEHRAELALAKAREALNAPIPELPPGPGGMPTGCRL
ncbi:MAG: helix-turn-helix domain-containing protein [Burkholderiales bacterium]